MTQGHSDKQIITTAWQREVAEGARFQFGDNWWRFLSLLNDERLAEAELSLKTMLDTETLDGLRFLDIGSGSGLFSLAARRLGAAVHSFDYDPQSVACARELKRRYFSDDDGWTIEQGSVLDKEFVSGLGKFDIVYSWGVLHHTGEMWNALENAAIPVKSGGRLFIAIYNDQGFKSKVWHRIKRFYCSGRVAATCIAGVAIPYFVLGGLAIDIVKFRNPLTRYRTYKSSRGMSIIRDWFDWLGGYPFEVAKPEEIFEFFKSRGFTLERIVTCGGGLGNNQFIFSRQ